MIKTILNRFIRTFTFSILFLLIIILIAYISYEELFKDITYFEIIKACLGEGLFCGLIDAITEFLCRNMSD